MIDSCSNDIFVKEKKTGYFSDGLLFKFSLIKSSILDTKMEVEKSIENEDIYEMNLKIEF